MIIIYFITVLVPIFIHCLELLWVFKYQKRIQVEIFFDLQNSRTKQTSITFFIEIQFHSLNVTTCEVGL